MQLSEAVVYLNDKISEEQLVEFIEAHYYLAEDFITLALLKYEKDIPYLIKQLKRKINHEPSVPEGYDMPSNLCSSFNFIAKDVGLQTYDEENDCYLPTEEAEGFYKVRFVASTPPKYHLIWNSKEVMKRIGELQMIKKSELSNFRHLTAEEAAEHFECSARTIHRYRKLYNLSKVKEDFKYDPETGVLTKGNKEITSSTILYNGKLYRTNRLRWLLHYGEEPKGYIKKLNDDDENYITNLRDTGL